jgi:hypothetical protein
MPVLRIKKPSEAPLPSRSSRAVREQQQKYDDFVRQVETNTQTATFTFAA